MSVCMDGMEGSRAVKMETDPQLTLEEGFLIGKPFRFAHNWMEGIRPLYTYDTKYANR